MQAFVKLTTRTYTNKRTSTTHEDKLECGLCYETFKPTDEVVNCKRSHCFHTACYEDLAQSDEEQSNEADMRNLCPTCNQSMNLTSLSETAEKQKINRHLSI